MNSGNTQPTFAKVFSNSTRPKRQYAIVIESKEGLTHDDYLDGLEKLIDLDQVKSISKISGNRVCLYLESKTLVDSLKNENVRIVVNALKNLGIRLLSSMKTFRASLSKPGRSHIVSFRRQFYIGEKDENKLPETLQLTHEDVTYWTYLTTDPTTCFICKGTGHISTACPQNSSISTDQFPELSKAPSGNDTNTTQSLQCLPTEPTNSMAQPNNSNINKIALSTSASEILTASADITDVPTISRNESRSQKMQQKNQESRRQKNFKPSSRKP
ncbi:hypothetical protein QAD02_023162 [Eretmocerus hayati]|uniref:Uncharacterized protein n=1 Tax=Eretmocerus hayati TaxID=131215 RepID=A0ACC2PV59_9HYME|nr:hypothetical protein QAD02_023162 [Eretmocerus hayati]